jgi:hypothetical protein
MFIKTGHSIFTHSRSSTSEVFCLSIIYNTHCMNIGKINPLKYYILSISEKIYE